MSLEVMERLKIIKGNRLENTIKQLYENFLNTRTPSSNLIKQFFNQDFFVGNKSLIKKLTSVDNTLTFDDIKDELINLGLLINQDNLYLRDFDERLKNTSIEFQTAFKQAIFDKVKNELGANPPYDNFDNECSITGESCSYYIQKIQNYLEEKSHEEKGKDPKTILNKIKITNENINSKLSNIIGNDTKLISNNPVLNTTIRDFDTLLAFEIGKEADYSLGIINDLDKKFENLFSNTIPGINTLIGTDTNSPYQYKESKFGDNLQNELSTIENDNNLSESEKERKKTEKKREFYIQYLKAQNSSLGNALEELYNNNFDYSKLSPQTLSNYLKFIAKEKTKSIYLQDVANYLHLNYGNKNKFIDFYEKLADPNENTIDLRGGIGPKIPVKKTIRTGENPQLKDINRYGENAPNYDTFPIEYEIDKNDIKGRNCSLEDQAYILKFLEPFSGDKNNPKYIIKGNDIGKLVFLYFLFNSPNWFSEIDKNTQDTLNKIFGTTNQKNSQDTDNNEQNTDNNNQNPDSDEQDTNNQDPNNEENTDNNQNSDSNEENTDNIQNFLEEINKIGPGKFETGSYICVPINDSNLPGGGHSRMRIKITNIDNVNGNFTGEGVGTEFNYQKKYIKNFKMNKDFLKNLEQIKKGNIMLLPDQNNQEFESYSKSLKNDNGEPIFNLIPKLKGQHFYSEIEENGNKKEIKINYFTTGGDNPGTYKISHNPSNKSFKVAASFYGEEDDKGTKKKVKYQYEQEMDYPSFLLFFKEKGLAPQTDEEAKIKEQERDNQMKLERNKGSKWKINRFTLGNIKNAYKNISGKIKKVIDGYNDSQNKKLQDIIERDWNIYGNLSSVLGFIPSLKGVKELEFDINSEEDKKVREKTDKIFEFFKKDEEFDNFDAKNNDKKTKALELLLQNPSRIKGEDKPLIAAFLLASIEKCKTPYFDKLAKFQNQGLYVQALLGPAHHEIYLKEKEKCYRDLMRAQTKEGKKEGLVEGTLQNILINSEITYITNNINGKSDEYFGSAEENIPGKNITPSKAALSGKFADQLGKYNTFDAKTSTKIFEEIGHNNFNTAKTNFLKNLKKGKHEDAMANLQKMLSLTRTPSHKNECQKYLLFYLLSGEIDLHGNKAVRDKIYSRSKHMNFIPGLMVKSTGHSTAISILLSHYDSDFSKIVKNKFNGNFISSNTNISELEKEMDLRCTNEKINELNDIFKYRLTIDSFNNTEEPNKSILSKFQDAIIDDEAEKLSDDSLSGVSTLTNGGGLTSSTNTIIKMQEFQYGKFSGDEDEEKNKKSFWKDITKELNNLKQDSNNPKTVNFVLTKFLKWFHLDYDRDTISTRLYTAHYRKERIGKPNTIKYQKGTKTHLIDMGPIGQKEINSIIWYALNGKAIDKFRDKRAPEELRETLDAFQDFFSSAFNNGTLLNNEKSKLPYKSPDEKLYLGSWDNYFYAKLGQGETYNEDKDGHESGDQLSPKERRKAIRDIYNNNYINPQIEDMNKRFKDYNYNAPIIKENKEIELNW